MKIGFIGGTGNVGQCVLRNLVSYPEEQVSQVVCVNRRKANPEELPEDQSRMVEHVVDMSPGTDVEPLFADVLSDIDVLVGTIGIGSGK
jgi:saccharopine dehydrogenase-like NADP-dependent oxidoreductase|tara:strand:- start:329 stop:595 length:267 start_codon:yes stop_codon:yes gene_type:complete